MFNQAGYTATNNIITTAPTNNTSNTITLTNAPDPNERDNLRILQTLNVQIQSMALKLDQILTQTEEVLLHTLFSSFYRYLNLLNYTFS
jgi:hypothetical protein